LVRPQILALYESGRSVVDTAHELGLADNTVRYHLSRTALDLWPHHRDSTRA
jgi:DNA-binding NarL/FixJ family response regulator